MSSVDIPDLKRLRVNPLWNPNGSRPFDVHRDEIMQVFLPIELWIANAVSFGQLGENRLTNHQEAYMTLVELFAETAQLAYNGVDKYIRFSFERVMHHEKPDETVGMQMRITYSGDAESLGSLMNRVLLANQERENKERERPRPAHAAPLCSYQKLTLPEYRRIVNSIAGYNITDAENSSSDGAIDIPDSIYYPSRAFSVDLSLLHAANACADREQTNIDSYFEMQDHYRVAVSNKMPQYWFGVNPASFWPRSVRIYEFPFVEHPESCENPERTLYDQRNDFGDVTIEDFPHNEVVLELVHERAQNRKRTRVDTEEDRKRMFDELLTRNTVADSILTNQKIADAMKQERYKVCEIKRLYDKQLQARFEVGDMSHDEFKQQRAEAYESFAKLDREATLRGLNMMRQVFHLHGPLPGALKLIADWLLKRIKSEGNFCLPIERITNNLTPYHESYAREMLQWENAYGVNVVHGQLSTTLMCVYAMLNGIKGVPHPGMFGPPEAGKTFTFDQLHELLIKDTCVNLTYATAKAKTGAASDYSYRVELYQEALPEQLGVETGRANTTAGATNNTNGESIFKTLLSESAITIQTVEIDKNTGKRRTVEIKSDCHMMIGVCSNVLVHAMPEAIRSRLLMWTMTEQQRTDNGGMAAACSKKFDSNLCEPTRIRVQRNQAVAALVGQLVLAHVLRPVCMDVANAIYAKLQTMAMQMNMLSFMQTRNRQRFMQLVRAVCIQRAIHTVFDFVPCSIAPNASEASQLSSSSSPDGSQREKPFHKRPFEWHHLTLLEPHMFVKVEDCVLVFGMLVHMYEDPIFYDVVETMKRDWFNNCNAPIFAPQPMLDPLECGGLVAVQGLEFSRITDYFVLHAGLSDAASKPHSNGSSHDSHNSGLMEKLAARLLGKMHNKPQAGEVVKILGRMEKLIVSSSDDADVAKDINALQFRDGAVMVSSALLQRNKPNQLAHMLTTVLQCRHAIAQQLLFRLSTDPNMPPFLFDLLKIESRADAPLLVIPNFDYVMQDEKHFMFPKTHDKMFPAGFMTHRHCSILDLPFDDYGEMLHKNCIMFAPNVFDHPAPTNTLAFMQWSAGAMCKSYPQMFERSNTQAYKRGLEKLVQDHPEQYCLKARMLEQNVFASPRHRRVLDSQSMRLSVTQSPGGRSDAHTASDADMDPQQLLELEMEHMEMHSDQDIRDCFSDPEADYSSHSAMPRERLSQSSIEARG